MRLYELFESVNDPHMFKAVFMAGAPGAGKSTIAGKLFSHTGLRVLNVDNFWKLYNAKGREGTYDHYWNLYKKQEENFVNRRMGLLIDGSAKNPEIMNSIKRRLESLGYDTAMVFVNTSLETSQARVISRAETIGRNVPSEFVMDSWNRTQKGLGQLQSMFGHNFYIVDNNEQLPDLRYVSKKLDKWLNTPPHLPAATKWIQDHKNNIGVYNAIT